MDERFWFDLIGNILLFFLFVYLCTSADNFFFLLLLFLLILYLEQNQCLNKNLVIEPTLYFHHPIVYYSHASMRIYLICSNKVKHHHHHRHRCNDDLLFLSLSLSLGFSFLFSTNRSICIVIRRAVCLSLTFFPR